jgi:REP element-mobilizing transposase RayT
MLLQNYQPHDLRFAYCYRVYLRWQTWRRQDCPPLAQIDRAVLQSLIAPYSLHVLETTANAHELGTLVSLRPADSVATCVSKIKGKVSKWLNQSLNNREPARLLSKGYFAVTCGASTRAEVEAYLDKQESHHGYERRALSPVYVETFPAAAPDLAHVCAAHSWAVVQLHVVLSTWGRRGVFGGEEARAVVGAWRGLQNCRRFFLRKVAVLPDHVHLALRLHPGVVPADLTAELMNAAQALLWREFPAAAIGAGVERLWFPSAYVGGFGELASPQIRAYLRDWQQAKE